MSDGTKFAITATVLFPITIAGTFFMFSKVAWAVWYVLVEELFS